MDTSMSFLDTGREPGDAPAAFLGFRHRVRPARRRGVEDVLLEVLSCAKADAEDEVDELAEPSYVETRPSPVNRPAQDINTLSRHDLVKRSGYDPAAARRVRTGRYVLRTWLAASSMART